MVQKTKACVRTATLHSDSISHLSNAGFEVSNSSHWNFQFFPVYNYSVAEKSVLDGTFWFSEDFIYMCPRSPLLLASLKNLETDITSLLVIISLYVSILPYNDKSFDVFYEAK